MKILSSSVQETERSVLIKDERFLNLVKRLGKFKRHNIYYGFIKNVFLNTKTIVLR